MDSKDSKFEINIEKLKNEVKKEVLAEEKYLRENSAKLRAIEQRVPTYEDFRQMVLASNLKPLDKGESLRDNINKSNKIWNSVADSSNNTENYTDFNKKLNLIKTIPKNNLEFSNIWKEIEHLYPNNDEIKWDFVYNLKQEKLSELFKIEINGELLAKFICLFDKKLKSDSTNQEECLFVYNLLEIFSRANRFKLNLMFLKQNEIDSLKNIFNLLEIKINCDLNFKKMYLS